MPLTIFVGSCSVELAVALVLHPDMVLFHDLKSLRHHLQPFFQGLLSLTDLVDLIGERRFRSASHYLEILGDVPDDVAQHLIQAKESHMLAGREAHGILNDKGVHSILLQTDMETLVSCGWDQNYVIPLLDPVTEVLQREPVDKFQEMRNHVDTLLYFLNWEARYPKRIMHMFVDGVTSADLQRFERQAALAGGVSYYHNVTKLLSLTGSPRPKDPALRSYFSQLVCTMDYSTQLGKDVMQQLDSMYGEVVSGAVPLHVYPLPTCTVYY